MTLQEQVKNFFKSSGFGVVGASAKRDKFGYKVFDCYRQHGYQAVPVHPALKELDGVSCVAAVSDLPANVMSLSIITPPKVTEKVVREAAEKGIQNIWIQPGAESSDAVAFCREQQINVISGGPCLLVELGCLSH